MRPGVVLAILFLAFGVLAVVFLFRPGHPAPAISAPPVVPVTPAATDLPEKAPPAAMTAAVTSLPIVAAPSTVPAANPPVSASDRVAELMTLAMNDDSNSLNTIWSELSNPDKDIRAGALAAVVQFGDRSVTPRLRDLAAHTDDPTEKAAIMDAANYLDLPPLTDLPRARSSSTPVPSH